MEGVDLPEVGDAASDEEEEAKWAAPKPLGVLLLRRLGDRRWDDGPRPRRVEDGDDDDRNGEKAQAQHGVRAPPGDAVTGSENGKKQDGLEANAAREPDGAAERDRLVDPMEHQRGKNKAQEK
jgi:hypothetical protein